MQKLIEWSGYHSEEIRATGLTSYIRVGKSWLSDQNITLEELEPLDSLPILEYAKVNWVIRITLERSEPLDSHAILEYAKLIEWSEYHSGEIIATGLTSYIGVDISWLSDQNITLGKSEPLDSLPICEYAKVDWVIRISLWRNQSHWTHYLY